MPELAIMPGSRTASPPLWPLKLYPYLQTKQLSGLLAGLKGASEYEHLVKEAGYSEGARRASRGMDALSTMHLVIIAFIILGNIGFFLSRWSAKKGKRT